MEGMIWMRGEAEASDSFLASEYGSNLNILVYDKIRAKLASGFLPENCQNRSEMAVNRG